MKFLAVLMCAGLLACPKAPVGSGSGPSPEALLEAAETRSVSYALRGRFSAKLSVPNQAIPSLPGALLLHPPGRMRMAMNAPIGGPVVTAVSDGVGLLLLMHRDGKAVLTEDLSETLRSMFGLEVTPEFFSKALMCSVPFDVSSPQKVDSTEASTVFHYQGLRGTRIEMSLQSSGMMDTLRAMNNQGVLELELTCSSPKKMEDQWMPGVMSISLPRLSMALRLKFSDWEELTKIPDAFGLEVPSGVETVGFDDIQIKSEELP